ncbi:isocitrate lyase/phosphoenolpyruvate mutase family protein [Amycolatopsis cynarae]|uniref:Isocitrate lyase/phosphoenolpyruvate mutase family protein n=1 Tax=Amycolatopsis cynarae TaxID=2995223 RepID=A0ABY7B9E7_9PSEU|nr:isocitrate lyase/phosphoenolpyruvate mutase family protein [Amycolatopsis sp. HUAS 11-8]WAL67867.1 isocitrate lyase/phosphoenolpyruvate mutase family protein [Amycolatopsis sp. HUAS 11-8]
MLTDPDYRVPTVPDADSGVGWLRAHVVRFSEGAAHQRRRALAERHLATVDVRSLRRPGNPVANLAEALGLPRSVAADVAVVAASYQPHTTVTRKADEAVARLVADCGGSWDEDTANRIGLLVQACDATNALIAGRQPPVPVTRRVTPTGEIVEVDLTATPFGAGRHACPGREHAEALAEGALAFHRLHDGERPLLLPNAWDLASAAALVDAGFPALGTTSLGVAAAHGVPDAAGLARSETLALATKLARFPVPVTVDIEAGFGADPGEFAAQLWELGVAGVNIEDGRGACLAAPAEHAKVVRALKHGAPGLFVNARVDTHWLALERESTIDRALRYVDAGADGIFVPGLRDERGIAAVVAATPAPVNVLAQRDIRVLADLGVRRISTGSLLFRAALGAAAATARAVRDGQPVGDVRSWRSFP